MEVLVLYMYCTFTATLRVSTRSVALYTVHVQYTVQLPFESNQIKYDGIEMCLNHRGGASSRTVDVRDGATELGAENVVAVGERGVAREPLGEVKKARGRLEHAIHDLYVATERHELEVDRALLAFVHLPLWHLLGLRCVTTCTARTLYMCSTDYTSIILSNII